MHISNLKIRNFRSIENIDINLNKGLNVLIGENNSGKTAIIDILRLILDKGNYPNEVYWKESDFRIDSNSNDIKPIEFDIRFQPEDEREIMWFNELHVISYDEETLKHYLEIHGRIRIIKSKGSTKIKREFWGGRDEERKIPWNIWNALNYIYLSPLRDIDRDLKPNNKNLLTKFFLNLSELKEEENYEENMSQIIKENFNAKEWVNLLDEGKEKITTHLTKMNFLDNNLDIDINFSTFEFEDILKKLIIQIPVNSDNKEYTKYFNLHQNGLGYNNLIYASTIFGDIIQRNEVFKQNYNLLLIEEPEAHLHPQLENTFFNYLHSLDEKEQFQLIVTSHSPTITAKTKLDNVIVMNNIDNKVCATPIKDTCLRDEDKIFLKKFLDVTKSQLFFAKGIILVEGITEALLLPIFAKLLDKKENVEKYNLEKNGIEIIVTGTSFQRYSGLFNSDNEKERLNIKCAVLTDDDKDKEDLSDGRLKNLEELSKNNFKVFLGKNTFEWELFNNNLENDIITKVFDGIHPKIRKSLINEGKEFNPDILVEKLSKNKTKSDFSFELAKYLENNSEEIEEFNIPEYIKKAIYYVTGEDYDN